jgi:toxin ParE1/3/4
MIFSLSVQAEEDIIAIAEHGIAKFRPIQAKRYHSDLFNTLDLIAKNPQMAREREEISPPVRIHPFKAHLIVYQIEQNGSVFILRIRNAFEDWISDPL